MKKQIQCKACKYIMTEDSNYEVCPACGVPRSAFESYEDKVSYKRRKIINLHLHPIMVHFPQAISTLIPPAILFTYIMPYFGKELFSTAIVLSLVLPASVIPAILAGLIDGKTRFKKLGTPHMRHKIYLAIILFCLSLILPISILLINDSVLLKIILLATSILCVFCQMLLGKIGSTLMEAVLPG